MTPTATATAVSFCRWGHLSKITDLPGVSLAPLKAPALTLSLERRSQLIKQTDRDRCTWYIASDLLASIYLEDVALRKHWKWTRVNSMLVAPRYVAAGIDQGVHLPNTLKPPDGQVPVLCILIKALQPSTPGFTSILLFLTYTDYWSTLRVCGGQENMRALHLLNDYTCQHLMTQKEEK